MSAFNTHGNCIRFGKFRGRLITCLSTSYLKWMIAERTPQRYLAKAEVERRDQLRKEQEK